MADAKTFISLATGPDDPDLLALRELDALFNGHDIQATDAHLGVVLRKATDNLEDGEGKWVRDNIAVIRDEHGLETAIHQAFYAATWEPEPPSPPVVCDACGTSFDTFCPGQAYGCDSGLTSDRTGFGGAYGSKHDCAYYTVTDPATFPGNNVCDVCIDAMLADGRLVDGRYVNLATGAMVPMDDDDEWEFEFETFGSDPGDMAVLARAYLNMTPEERADFDRDLPDARSELRAFIDSLDDEP